MNCKMEKNYQPIYVLPESKAESTPQKNNIKAAKLVADTIRTTLGPKGMDKLLVNSMNEIIITNDGVTILNEMEIQHPIAKMIVEIARTQESEVGDGTTSAVILAGEFLSRAEGLMERKIHPTIITKGFRLASEKATEFLYELATNIDLDNVVELRKIVRTAMTGKGADLDKDTLSKIVVDAMLIAKDKNNVSILKNIGVSTNESKLINGLIIDKYRVHPGMPKIQENAKIILLNCPLELKDTETDAKITITNPLQMKTFLEQEESMLKEMVSKIINSGANVVFCQKGIDDLVQYFLAKKNIIAFRRMKQSEMSKISSITGSKIIYDLNDLNDSCIGKGKIEEINFNEEKYVKISDTIKQDLVTIVVSGNTSHVADEIVRAVEDALGDLHSVIKTKKIVAGAGAIEIQLSKKLDEFAKTLKGREQLAVLAFAESLKIIPKTLAENAGLDPIDVIAELTANSNPHIGIDVFTGKSMDAMENGIIEPINVKIQAIQSAVEVANMILRIDDIIVTNPERQSNPRLPDDLNYN